VSAVRVSPSALNAGDTVQRVGNLPMTFIARDARARLSILRCDAFKGQLGPDDEGCVTVPDHEMGRYYVRVPHA